ncbi:MAG: helix-turn-helix transcriptional regulator [Planctomycetota bacterium]|jgi:predicted DNA-binding transcriptional regulator AlpA
MSKLLLTPSDVAATLSMSRAKFYQLCSTGAFGPMPIKFGRKTLYRTSDIEKWVEGGCKSRSVWLGGNNG